jgi:PhnB protein
VTGIEPELWVDSPRRAIAFYEAAFGATVLVVDDPDATTAAAVAAGAVLLSPVADEHGWRLGRIEDPAGHEWEIGRPPGEWPP